MTTQAEFFQQHAVNGVLPDNLMADFLSLPEGDISVVVDVNAPTLKDPGASPDTDGQEDPAAAPAAAATPAPAAAAPAATPAPAPADTPAVILAKDGQHTIPYERLEEARQAANAAKQQAEEAARRAAELEAENQRLKAAVPSPAPAPATTTPAPAPAAEEGSLFGDYSDPAIRAGVEKLIAGRTQALEAQIASLKQQLTPVQQAAQLTANEEHWRTIYSAHPDADSLVESAELNAWIQSQPKFVQAAYEKVLDEGTAQEVVELYDAYKTATGKTTPPPPAASAPAPAPAAAAAAQAAAAIANAKQPPPTSLSEIPAGTAAHHDEAAAMLEATPAAVLQRLEGLSPVEIEKRLSRIL